MLLNERGDQAIAATPRGAELSSGLSAKTTIYGIAGDLHNVIKTHGDESMVAVGHAARRREILVAVFSIDSFTIAASAFVFNFCSYVVAAYLS